MKVILNNSTGNQCMNQVLDGKPTMKDNSTAPDEGKEASQQEEDPVNTDLQEITPEKIQEEAETALKVIASIVEGSNVAENVDVTASAQLMDMGTTATMSESNDGFQTPNQKHQVSAAAMAEAATAKEGVMVTNNSFMALTSLGATRAQGASPAKLPTDNQSPQRRR
jgi:hypothetical protein